MRKAKANSKSEPGKSARNRPSRLSPAAQTDPVPVALTIAGSDSGGGAGIQADLKTFAALGVHGTSAITCVTAQNPAGVLSIQPIRADIIRDQIEAVRTELRPRAIKTGMLFSREIIRVVVEALARDSGPPLVVDPVMVASSGRRLLAPRALKALQKELLPIATLVTPNVCEAEVLTGLRMDSPEDLRRAGREIRARYGCAALVKGGHLRGAREAVDFFYDGTTELMLIAPFLSDIKTHGTGCTYSAAITAYLAKGCDLAHSVAQAKQFMTDALAGHFKVHSHDVLRIGR